jgi:hypothetical protein
LEYKAVVAKKLTGAKANTGRPKKKPVAATEFKPVDIPQTHWRTVHTGLSDEQVIMLLNKLMNPSLQPGIKNYDFKAAEKESKVLKGKVSIFLLSRWCTL